jgi:antitoxin VapB
MKHIAKIFMNGRSQAVRLPKAFRFDADEVFVRRDPKTGDVVLSSKRPPSMQELMQLFQENPVDANCDFLLDRHLGSSQERVLF